MKEWKNPQLLSLGVESTHDHDTCHKYGDCLDTKHPLDEAFNGIVHTYTSCEKHASCCCYEVQSNS